MVPSAALTKKVNTDVAFIQTIHNTADHLMNSKPLLAMATAVAAIIAGFCAGALIRYRWSRQVIKLKQEEGWTLVARVNSVDFIHPWNNFIKPPARIWFVKPDTLTHFNGNIVFFRALTIDYDGSRIWNSGRHT